MQEQIKCSHCSSTKLKPYNSTTVECCECGGFTKVEEHIATSIAKKVVICLGAATILGTIGALVGGPPGAVAGASLASVITGKDIVV